MAPTPKHAAPSGASNGKDIHVAFPHEDLWTRYWANPIPGGDDESDLVALHLNVVKRVADRIYQGLPNNVEHEEVMQNGRHGLLEAVRNWKPELAAFNTYANLKIKSKILDGLRHADWLSRDMRKSVRAVQTATTRLEAKFNRAPTDEEIAADLGLSVENVQAARLHHKTSHVASLDNLRPNQNPLNPTDAGNLSFAAHLHDATDMTPHELAEQKQDHEQLRAALATLGPRDRQIIALYYYENLTLANIGEILNVTESRVCQIRSRALSQLQAALVADGAAVAD